MVSYLCHLYCSFHNVFFLLSPSHVQHLTMLTVGPLYLCVLKVMVEMGDQLKWQTNG